MYKIRERTHSQYAKTAETAQFFTDTEAWNLFRLAAFGEAFGWTLLISSLLIKHYLTPGNNIPVDIAGQIHGTIFLIYIAAVVVLHPSLRWTPKRTLIAGLVSVPPYGTLVFEQWVAHKRKAETTRSYRLLGVRGLIVQDHKLLAMQPKDSSSWYLPGGPAKGDETANEALERIITDLTSIKPLIGNLVYVWRNQHNNMPRLELLFIINNAQDYKHINLKTAEEGTKELDEIGFINPQQQIDLQPQFLQATALSQMHHRKHILEFI